MKRLVCWALAALMMPAIAAHANNHFTNQASPATGSFEWHTFAGAYANAHAPNASAGLGAATLTGQSIVIPGPPQFPSPLIDGGSLYTGGRRGRFPVDVTGASTSGFTTVVLQLAIDAESSALIDESTLKLDGAAPTSYINRGVAVDNLLYHWASWQIAADADFATTFDTVTNHFALSGAKLDYYNGAAAFSAVVPAEVPEPSSIALAAFGLSAAAFRLARRRRAETNSRLG